MTDLTNLTLGRRIQALRKEQGMTQDALAEQMGVTPQAVSKWENDQSCPDILSLPRLAALLHVTVDTLLTGQSAETAPARPPKKPEELIVRMAITDEGSARVCVNLPFTVFRLCARYDMISFTFHAEEGELDAEKLAQVMAGLNFRDVADLIENGARGKLVDAAGILTIWTE